ncbi:histidine kinase [Polaribacter porphyrae]|uniref:Histidine kinase n=1 Tax=Polaribacter porphyrae TaxID=1137780 RepID=A0A2S7WJR0_9FLAO|nr:histidine kinase [Polaribacter porphyrae]PQJ77847.1 histidine kinase [Polaribacter porphyrae]
MEQPNLLYIEQLARGEQDVRKALIDVIKSEFPEEKEIYYKSLQKKDFEEIKGNVHRIKHKFSILGLEKSYNLANEYEKNLVDGYLDANQVKDFEAILAVISKYIKTI